MNTYTPEITALNPSNDTITVRWDGAVYYLNRWVVEQLGMVTALAMTKPDPGEYEDH